MDQSVAATLVESMNLTLANLDPAPPPSSEQLAAGVILVFVLIVLTSGVIAITLYLRSRMRDSTRTPPTPKKDDRDAWVESGKRLFPDDDASGDQSPDDDDPGSDDDDDDDPGEPTPPVPLSPETAASL